MNSNIKYKYYDEAIEYYSLLSKHPIYKKNTKLYYATHLNGPHIDFYHEPYSLNKNTPLRNFKKFNKSILKSINNLSSCEKYGLYLNKSVVKIMIDQITLILNENQSYWENYNFNLEIIKDINKVYVMYKLYLETYLNRIKNEISENTKISYKMSLATNLGMNVDHNKIILLGEHQITKIISQLEQLHKKKFNLILEDFKNQGTPCESESELLSLIMKHILDLYYKIKTDSNFSELIIPEPHTIKLKWIQPLKSQWSSKGKVSGRYFFLNNSNINAYKKEQLLRLTIHEILPGHIMFRTNTNQIVKSYLKSKTHIKKHVKKLLKSGTKAVNEGFASYIEKILLNFDNNIETQTLLLFGKLFHAIRMILDVKLNMGIINEHTAINILKNTTILSETGIKSEINKYYANPGRSCAYSFGSCCYNILEHIYKNNSKLKNDFYKDMFTLQLPIPIIFKYVDDILLNKN